MSSRLARSLAVFDASSAIAFSRSRMAMSSVDATAISSVLPSGSRDTASTRSHRRPSSRSGENSTGVMIEQRALARRLQARRRPREPQQSARAGHQHAAVGGRDTGDRRVRLVDREPPSRTLPSASSTMHRAPATELVAVMASEEQRDRASRCRDVPR